MTNSYSPQTELAITTPYNMVKTYLSDKHTIRFQHAFPEQRFLIALLDNLSEIIDNERLNIKILSVSNAKKMLEDTLVLLTIDELQKVMFEIQTLKLEAKNTAERSFWNALEKLWANITNYISDMSDKAYPKRINEVIEEIESNTFVPAITFKNVNEVENYINQLLVSV